MSNNSRNTRIQELILRHGLILESEVYNSLRQYYGLRLNQNSKVCLPLAGEKGETREVDVYAAILQNRQIIQRPFFNQVEDTTQKIPLVNVMNIFLIECKGHSSDGILLCRLHDTQINEKILLTNYIYLDRTDLGGYNQWREGLSRMEVSPIVDSCAFYSLNGKNLNEKNHFTEDKNKLFKALQQISAAGQLFDQNFCSFRRSFPNVYDYTVTPLICTNIPITIIKIEGENLKLIEVDWAYILNLDFGAKYIAPNKPNYKFIPIVKSSALTKFCDAIMAPESGFLNINLLNEKIIHKFNIKDAQQMFRSELKNK